MVTVHLANPDRRDSVLRILRLQTSQGRQSQTIIDLLESLRRGTLPLEGLLVAEHGGVPTGVCLYAMQPDRCAFVWPPVILTLQNAEDTADALLGELCTRLEAEHVWLGQCLLLPEELAHRARLARNGFTHLSDMAYLERTLASAQTPRHELETVVYDPKSNSERFARLIERTYPGTQDCPALNGMRTGAEALEGHRTSGDFDPSRWKIFRRAGHDAGLLLLNEHPDQNAWEVVYMGVVPEARGQGLGRDMLLSGLAEARAAGRGSMLLAVDTRNNYARRIYSELGFVELAVRAVYVRFSSQRVSQNPSAAAE